MFNLGSRFRGNDKYSNGSAVHLAGTSEYNAAMLRLMALIVPVILLTSCANRHDEGKRSDLEVWLLNLGQIVYDSAKQANRPDKDY